MIVQVSRYLSIVSLCLASAGVSALPNHDFQFGSEDVTARITGGNPIAESQAPYMAGLLNESNTVFCGAVLIDSQHLLTAAHCIARFVPNQFTVRLANQVRRVDRVFISNTFRWSHLNRDLGVIRLAEPVANAQPVSLATSLDINSLPVDSVVSILGYGQSQTNGPFEGRLMQGNVPFVPTNMCADAWREQFPSLATMISQDSICASGNGFAVDTCTGDSGGPLLYNNGTTTQLLAVTSFGEPACGSADKPSVYARVDAFQDIIQKAQLDEAYYTNWAQVLVDPMAIPERQVLSIVNTTDQTWLLGATQADPAQANSAAFSIDRAMSNCEGAELAPGASCRLEVGFAPTTAGFFTGRFLLQRQSQSPIWIDVQGFGFQPVPDNVLEDERLYSFVGGEIAPSVQNSGGLGNSASLVVENVPALETSEFFIGSDQNQTLNIGFEFQPNSPQDQTPNIEVRTLNAYDEVSSLSVDRTPGWQYSQVELATDDFVYVRVQAKGQGLSGRLIVDTGDQVVESGTIIPNQSANQNFANTPSDVKSGGVIGLLLGFGLFLFSTLRLTLTSSLLK